MRMLFLVLLSACVSLAGCSDEQDPDEPVEEEQEQEEAELNCGGPSPARAYYDGISAVSESERYTLSIMASTPAPPVKGDNTVMLQIMEGDEPADDVSVVVSPYMPHHRHGTAPADYAASLSDGLFEVPAFYLFMPGYWEYNVTITGADGDEDKAVFAFCVDG